MTTSTTPKATIVLPCFDASASIVECLASLIGQEAGFPFEILAVENGSRDGTLALLERTAGAHPKVLRVLQEPKPGAYAARNRGIREASGEVLAFIDADCVASPTWLSGVVAGLSDGLALAGGEIVSDPTQHSVLARYAARSGILSQAATLAHPRGAFLQTANLAIRRNDALAVGGFDEALFSGGDADFCWRVLAERPGARIGVVPGATVAHRHRESVAALYRQFRRYGQSDVMLARKHGARRLFAAGKLGADLLRLVLALPAALLLAPVSLVLKDGLYAAAPLLRAVRILGRWRGRLIAARHPEAQHRA